MLNYIELPMIKPNIKLDENAYVEKINPILVIDDQSINLKVITLFLNSIGFKLIDYAQTGNEGLNLYHKNNYSLVILDIGLPDINGLEICRIMKQKYCEKKTPIIAFTAYHNSQDECILAGFDDYMQKPLDIDILKGVLNKWIPKL